MDGITTSTPLGKNLTLVAPTLSWPEAGFAYGINTNSLDETEKKHH
jgi:hypothetical protein